MNKSVYKYAAEAGVPIGIYLTMMSACVVFSLYNEYLPLLLLPLIVGFPFFTGWLMARVGKAEPAYRNISSLWLSGIYMVIFGTLICTLVTALYLRYVDPGFIHAYWVNTIVTLEKGPMAAEYAETVRVMKEAIKARMLPSAMEFVSTIAWTTCFLGSVMSLVIACILCRLKFRRVKGSGFPTNLS